MSALLNRAQSLADAWRTDASNRRAMSPHDLSADVLEFCAKRMLEELAAASEDDEELTPAEFGDLPHVNKSASQVRRWCQFNQIEHRRVGRDYRICRGATVPGFGVAAA